MMIFNPPAGLHALRAGIPKAAFTPCRRVRKRRFAYATGSLTLHCSLLIVNCSFFLLTFSFLPHSSLLIVNSSLLIYVGFSSAPRRHTQSGLHSVPSVRQRRLAYAPALIVILTSNDICQTQATRPAFFLLNICNSKGVVVYGYKGIEYLD
jgi:hypothetical protein